MGVVPPEETTLVWKCGELDKGGLLPTNIIELIEAREGSSAGSQPPPPPPTYPPATTASAAAQGG
eukprot:5252536-Lingulodinium_polyedra.AAC.1